MDESKIIFECPKCDTKVSITRDALPLKLGNFTLNDFYGIPNVYCRKCFCLVGWRVEDMEIDNASTD